jgi:microcompartment protein CcmL/EutN
MAKAAGEASRPLGAIEWDSIAQGVRAADALVKAAPVTPVVFRPVTPGRYFALYAGEVEAVQAATLRALEVGGASVLDHLVLPSPHKTLVPAIKGKGSPDALMAIGIIETLTMCSLILAADAAAKTGEVRLHEVRLAMGLGGKAFVVVTGEVSNVEAAVERGSALAAARGYLLSSVVIPNPDPAALAFLAKPASPFRDFEL